MKARQMMTDASTLQNAELVVSAKKMMHQLCLSQMVVLQAQTFCGIVSLEELERLPDDSLQLIELQKSFSRPVVSEDAHIFDVMKTALQHQSKVVAVVDADAHFLGIISAEVCLRWFGMLSSVQDAGGVIELQMPVRDYSLSEISRLAESNQAQVICCFTNLDPATDQVKVTLRLNQNDLAVLVQTYERHGYTVAGLYNEEEYTADLKDRYDALIRFLNV